MHYWCKNTQQCNLKILHSSCRISIRLKSGQEGRFDLPSKTNVCVHICVSGPAYTSVGSGFTFAVPSSGSRPEQEVGQRSASFDWQHFFGEAGSSAVDSAFDDEPGLFFFFFLLAVFHSPPPLHLLSVLPLRAAQWRALKSQKNFFFFLPPCNLDKARRFNESVWKEKWSLVSNPSSVCVSIRQFNPD